MSTIEVTDMKDMLNKTREVYGDRPVYRLRNGKARKF